jgi:TRL-like protein family
MLKKIALLILLILFASGCLYTNIQRPLDKNFHTTDLGSKEGLASNQSILWLFAWGDAGTKAAAENGDISVIKHADQETLVVLFGLYFRVTTVVYGD